MEWSRRRFLGASIMATAYSGAKAVAGPFARDELILNFEDAGGSTTNTGEENNKAFLNAINYLNGRGGTLFIPDKIYPFSGRADTKGKNVTVLGYGATFIGDHCQLRIKSPSTGFNIHGLRIIETSGEKGAYVFECSGSDCHFKDVHLERSPPTPGRIAYCRENTSGNLFENMSFVGSNGIGIGGHDHEIRGGWGDCFGTDDAWAITATIAPCYNIRISGFKGKGFASIFAIGSPIGVRGADDPDRRFYVKNVLVENCVAQECTYLVFIKPGGLVQNDYRDGTVEDVQIINCRHEDPAGAHFRRAIYVVPARGAIVRRLTIKDLVIRARGSNPPVQGVNGLLLLAGKMTNGAGAGGFIEDVLVTGVQCIDPFGGAPTSNSTPGIPMDSLIEIKKADPGVGNIGRVQVSDAFLDGSARMGARIGPQVGGPIAFNHCTFKNYSAAIVSSVDKGSVLANSPVNMTDITAIPSPNAPPDTRGVMPDAHQDKTVEYVGEVANQPLSTVPAGASVNSRIHTAPRDTWISKVEIVVGETIPQDDIDFVRFTLRNGSNGKILAQASTTKNGLLLSAGQRVSINGADQFSGDAAALAGGAQLIVEITHEGAGAAVVDPVFVIHSVPYGQA